MEWLSVRRPLLTQKGSCPNSVLVPQECTFSLHSHPFILTNSWFKFVLFSSSYYFVYFVEYCLVKHQMIITNLFIKHTYSLMYKQYSCKKKNKKIILTHIHISFTHEMSFCHVCSLSIIISQKWERKKLSDNTLYNKPGQRILLKKKNKITRWNGN